MLKLSKIKSYLLLAGGVFCSASVASQNATGWKDYHYVKQSHAWFDSENASGLKELQVNDISLAEIYYQKSNGKFVDYYQSNDSYRFGANIESLYRLNPKIVLYGKINYDNFKGKNMSGSAFISPERNPFDIVEFTDTNKGKKTLENYHLIGAVSASLFEGLALGGKIDFLGANYAKDKDLRHKNMLTDINVAAGLSYRFNKIIEAGVNYYYRRRVEGVTFNKYGSSDQQFLSLIDYGAFYGKGEVFGETGYTAKGVETPLFDKYHGASLQLVINPLSNLSLFNELTYKTRDGYFGSESTYGVKYTTIIKYTEHSSDIIAYKGRIDWKQKNNSHILDFGLRNEELKNLESVYKVDKDPGKYTYRVTYFDPLEVGDKKFLDISAVYTANLGVEDYNPTWIIKGGFDYNRRIQKLSFFPFFRKQTIKQTSMHTSIARNIIKGDNMYTILLGVGYSSGNGVAKDDGSYITPGEDQSMPRTIDTFLEREYEYLTANQIKGDVGFKYSRLFPKVKMKGYAALNYSLTKAQDIKYLAGDSFNRINLTLGCTF